MEKLCRRIKFEKKYLNSLKEDSHACVEVIKNVRHLSLHPFHLSDVNNSIKEILGEQIAKYDKKLNGILLSFQNIKLLRSIGSINFDSSFVHIDIEAEFFVFKPETGKVLHGVVNKKSKDHVGCLVHKFFNVSLPRPVNCENWLGSAVQIGHEIEFCITFTNLEARLPYIKAEIRSLLSEDSGISTGEEGNNLAVNTITKFNTDESADENNGDIISSSQRKSRKRKFSQCTSNYDEDEAEILHENHKRRKRSNENDTSYTLTGILNYIEEGETSKESKVKKPGENNEENWNKGKKLRKSKHNTDINQEEKRNSALSDEADSKNGKKKRKMSELEDSFTIKRRRVVTEVEEEEDLPQESSTLTKTLKYEGALSVSDMKDKKKRKNSANGILLDSNLGEIFNETFTIRKSKNKKKPKVDVETITEKESRELQVVNRKKNRSNENSVIFSELNLNDSLIQKSESTIEKSKKKKRKNSGFDLSELNFDDIINESVVQVENSNPKKNQKSEVTTETNSSKSATGSISKSEKKSNKSQSRFVEENSDISKNERKRSKCRDTELNLARELFPSQISKSEESKSKKKKKRDSDLSLSQINFENIINESTVEVNEAKSKKNPKKKLKKSKDRDADVSLPELNLDQLFNEDVNKRNNILNSHENSSWENRTFELPSDSDMENIFSSCFPKSSRKSKKKT